MKTPVMIARALAAASLALLSGCATQYFRDAGAPPFPPPRYSLADLPQPEYWSGIVFNGAKVGFSHSRVARAPENGLYELHGEAVIRFHFLGLEKNVQMRSLDTVDENAKLMRFAYHYVLDGTEQDLTGEVRDGRLRYQVITAKRSPEQNERRLDEPLYPATALEDERAAKNYLASAVLNKDDVIVSWSLVKAPFPLSDPRQARFLKFALLAQGGKRAPLSDSRQRCTNSGRDLVCEIDATRSDAEDGTAAAALLPSSTVQNRDPMIRKLALSIAAGKESATDKIDAVLAWLERNIRKEPVDTFSALDVLDAKRGECQGHSYLYAALMRALDVPTRVVNGLVYSAEFGGFLYHTWAESLVEGAWRAVDPTFNQTEADATHIALVRGENLADLTPLVDWIGNTRIRVLEAR